jgi:predicted nuclease of predicted toxin-antitoxin system
MLRLLADENFNDDIVRGLLRRQAEIDIVCARDVGLTTAEDARILAWAAENGRIVLTHDRATMPDFAFERVAAAQPMPGLFVLSNRLPVGKAIEEILLAIACTQQAEWTGLVAHLPL